jgi:glyoxylase-like metal-dependent hydrolase (beta-lactamase superfamily II)
MTRGIALGLLLGSGALAMATAQSPAPSDTPKVIEVEKVKDNLWVLRGGGGNTAVFATAGGVVVVDAKNPGWGQPVLDKIKTLTDKPVVTLINTHTHGDHVSGNVAFPASVEVVTHENTKANMAKMPVFEDNAQGLPDKTFKERMTLGKGADRIDLYYFGPGHTGGDAWVAFPAHRIVHAGDMFARKGMPFFDGNNGGSVLRYPETLMNAYNGIKDVDTIINGHMPAQSTWADLKEYADFTRDFVAFGQAQLAAGRTAEQAAAEWKMPAKYQGYSANVQPERLKASLELLASETKK